MTSEPASANNQPAGTNGAVATGDPEGGLRIVRVHSEPLRQQVYALRYRAYRREGAIDANSSGIFSDAYDLQPNHILWGLMDGPKVIGSIRTMWYEPGEPWAIPKQSTYLEDMKRALPENCRVVSGNRLTIDPSLGAEGIAPVMFLLRQHLVVAGSGWAVCAVRRNRAPFYARVMGALRASDGRIYPGLKCAMHLLVRDFRTNLDAVYRNNPVLKPSGSEQLLLDTAAAARWELGIKVS